MASSSAHGAGLMHHAILTWNGHAGHPASRSSNGVISKILEWVGKSCLRREARGEVVHHGHVSEVETARSAGVKVVVIHGEVSIAVGVRT